MADKIIAANREHPDWGDTRLAEAVGCTRQYVHIIGTRHNLVRPFGQRNHKPQYRLMVKPDDGLMEWLDEEAERMGPGVKPHDVVVAILRDAMAGDE